MFHDVAYNGGLIVTNKVRETGDERVGSGHK